MAFFDFIDDIFGQGATDFFGDVIGSAVGPTLTGIGAAQIVESKEDSARELQEERIAAEKELAEDRLAFMREQLAAQLESAAAARELKEKLAKRAEVQGAFRKLMEASLAGRQGEAATLANLAGTLQRPLIRR